MPSRPLHHAVVVGGSISGLLATRVLSDHFEQVTLVERDVLPRAPAPRKGVPQARHAHGLLIRGRTILESLLPGLAEDLCAAGAVSIDVGREFGWYHAGGWSIQHESELVFLSVSRVLLELSIGERMRARRNVRVLDGVRAGGLKSDTDGTVRGVRVSVPGEHSLDKEIDADLVIDATGRGSTTPQYIRELGFAAPKAELLPAPVTYASCMFRRANDRPNNQALLISGTPGKRSGVLLPIESGRWLVTLVSHFDEPTPKDHDAFVAFARSLPALELYQAIRDLEPSSDIVHHRFAGSLWRHYEQLTRFPEGLLVLGDAVCSFNPVYGQGMTVSAIEAECLDRALTRARDEGGIDPAFAQRWFRTIQPVVDAAWSGASLEDYRFPELAHERSVRSKLLRWYMDRVNRATFRSAAVTDQLYRVIHVLEPPGRLFRPRILAEVLFGRGVQRTP
jgi:2-polyprenyl-6-methoxyphenol hydroxylase-like FAD-dependent oxidoreductase